MRQEPTLAEKIESLRCLDELAGFEGQIRLDGRMTEEVAAMLAVRRAELMRGKFKR